MKTSNIALLILFIACAGLFFWCQSLKNDNQKLARVLKQRPYQSAGVPQNEEIDRFKASPSSPEVTTFKNETVTPEDLKNGKSAISPLYLDSLANALNVRASKITEYEQLTATLNGKIKAYKIELDSLKRKTYFFQQKYLTAKFSEVDTALEYNYSAIIDKTEHKANKGFLGMGKTEYKTSISSPDSNMTINGLRQFDVKQTVRKKPFGIGLQVGYHYSVLTREFEPSFGFGVSLNLIRL